MKEKKENSPQWKKKMKENSFGKFFLSRKEIFSRMRKRVWEREKRRSKKERKKIYIRNFHQTKVTFFILQSEQKIKENICGGKKKENLNENWKLSWKKKVMF